MALDSSRASIGIHVLAGLPTQAVRSSFEWMGSIMTLFPLGGIAGASLGEATRVGVLLPPFVEPAPLVESWLKGDTLSSLFGRPAHLASITTLVDTGDVVDQISSAAPLSRFGWGHGEFDRRSLADIVVGQIESASHLVMVGNTPVSESLSRCLAVLNPEAACVPIREGSLAEMNWFAGQIDGGVQATEASGATPVQRTGQKHLESVTTAARTAAVVPPWLKLLQGEGEPRPGLLAYRRTRPFDPTRLHLWLQAPPEGILRAKGRVWFASEPDQSFGYSCAGSVHRVFPAGRWWASCGEGAWPTLPADRKRLLEGWHPRFGDRRQELVFAGVDLDADELFAGLDTCLVAEDALDESLESSAEGLTAPLMSGLRIH